MDMTNPQSTGFSFVTGSGKGFFAVSFSFVVVKTLNYVDFYGDYYTLLLLCIIILR